jgi:hypothetical protein
MSSQAFQELTLKISQKENPFNIADCRLEIGDWRLQNEDCCFQPGILNLKSQILNVKGALPETSFPVSALQFT